MRPVQCFRLLFQINLTERTLIERTVELMLKRQKSRGVTCINTPECAETQASAVGQRLNPVSHTGIHADDFGSHTDRPHETPSIHHHGSLRG